MKRVKKQILTITGTMILAVLFFSGCYSPLSLESRSEKQPFDYVNPYMDNISHLLVPTFPTVHLPNSRLRITPKRYGLFHREPGSEHLNCPGFLYLKFEWAKKTGEKTPRFY